jgi:arsenate reductase
MEWIEHLERYIEALDTGSIPEGRRKILDEIADYVYFKVKEEHFARLNFICTHNSRRSQMGQVWAEAMARYFKVKNVQVFSGGTEATAFNPNAVKALEEAGFKVTRTDMSDNPVYQVAFSEKKAPILCFSKRFDDDRYTPIPFAAVMTCSDVEENCPYIPTAEEKFSLNYEDPKAFDGTEEEAQAYRDRCRQIATEMKYVFSEVKNSSSKKL